MAPAPNIGKAEQDHNRWIGIRSEVFERKLF
jgi:hypothetical protein